MPRPANSPEPSIQSVALPASAEKGTSIELMPDRPTIANLRRAASGCKACDLWKNATQTVFGEGKLSAAVMFVGEQPGDREDRTGRPFVPKRDQFAPELLYFSDCILTDKEPEPSGHEGLADVRVMLAIYESVRTRAAVKLPELPIQQRPTKRQEIHRAPVEAPKTVRAKSPSGEAA